VGSLLWPTCYLPVCYSHEGFKKPIQKAQCYKCERITRLLGVAFGGGLIACTDSSHAHHKTCEWDFIYKWTVDLKVGEANNWSARIHAAKLGLGRPMTGCQHFNMHGISWTVVWIQNFSTFVYLELSICANEDEEEEEEETNKWEQVRQGQIKAEGQKEMRNTQGIYARWPWEWQLGQQNKFECWFSVAK